MGEGIISTIGVLLVLSAIVFVLSLVYVIRSVARHENVSLSRKLLMFFIVLLLAIWLIHISMLLYTQSVSPDEDDLSTWEVIVESFMRALQTATLEGVYSDSLNVGKDMIALMTGGNAFAVSIFAVLFTMENVGIVLASAATILSILTNTFPRVRLSFVRINVLREIFYFSVLNERSLVVAESLISFAKEKGYSWWRRPCIVFNNVSQRSEDDDDTDLIYRAKLLGAICVDADVVHMKPRRFARLFTKGKAVSVNSSYTAIFSEETKMRLGGTRFFLIEDEDNEMSNLTSLADLVSVEHSALLENAIVYLFSQDDIYEQVERQMLSDSNDQNIHNVMPAIRPVQSYNNLVYNSLLIDMPFYEPLIGRSKDTIARDGLTITIVGAGQIGMQTFLSAYWSGQILDCPLHINVVSDEREEDFVHRVDYISRDIMRTATKDDGLLRIYDDESKYSEPYFTFHYVEADVEKENVYDLFSDDDALASTDYLVISTGSDERNLSLAEELKRALSVINLRRGTDSEGNTTDEWMRKNTVIAYVVYDSELAELFKKERYDRDGTGILMYAFGSLRDVYDFRNIVMARTDRRNIAINNTYETLHHVNVFLDPDIARADKEGYYKRWYRYGSSIARIIHRQYKLFSLGLIAKSHFDSTIEEVGEANTAALKEYQEFAFVGAKFGGDSSHVGALESWCIVHGENALHDLVAGIEGHGLSEEELEMLHFERVATASNDTENVVDTRLEGAVRHLNINSLLRLVAKVLCALDTANVDILDEDISEYLDKVMTSHHLSTRADAVEYLRVLQNRMSWLEHRRWNSYLRSVGYRTPKRGEIGIFEESKESKSLTLRIHACLVECNDEGVLDNVYDEALDFDALDMLDRVSVYTYRLKGGDAMTDLKVYDYPSCDF